MEYSQLLPMFLLGLFGTGHCVGMCGPLVVAATGATGAISPQLMYHTGRITTYTAIGAIMGLAGYGLIALGGKEPGVALKIVTQVQIVISLIAAGLLLLFGLIRLNIVTEPRIMSLAEIGRASCRERV